MYTVAWAYVVILSSHQMRNMSHSCLFCGIKYCLPPCTTLPTPTIRCLSSKPTWDDFDLALRQRLVMGNLKLDLLSDLSAFVEDRRRADLGPNTHGNAPADLALTRLADDKPRRWDICTALQRQTAVTAYLKSKQLLLFPFVQQCTCRWENRADERKEWMRERVDERERVDA